VTSRGLLLAWLGLACLNVLLSCARAAERPACAELELGKLEAAYVNEVVTACKDEGFDACKARPAIEEKYAALRKDWIACR
jgi:hypothetical protein